MVLVSGLGAEADHFVRWRTAGSPRSTHSFEANVVQDGGEVDDHGQESNNNATTSMSSQVRGRLLL